MNIKKRSLAVLSAFAVVMGFAQTRAIAAPISATPTSYSAVTPHILRTRQVSQSRALRSARPQAFRSGLASRLEAALGSTTMSTVRVSAEGRTLRLKLAEYEPDLDSGQVLQQLPDGSWVSEPVRRDGTRFYIGHAAREGESFAMLYRTESAGWGGRIELRDGTYILEPAGWTDPTAVGADGSSPSYIFREDETEEFLHPGSCGDGGIAPADPEQAAGAGGGARHIVQNGRIVKYEIRYIATDEYWAARGSSDSVVGNEIFAMHNAVSNLMQGQVSTYGVALHTTWTVLHSNLPTNPFTNPDETDGGVLLDDVIQCKASPSCLAGEFYGSGQIAVLLVARPALHKPAPDTGQIVGIAKVGGLCSGNSAAVIETTGSQHARFARLGHELGHVFGACHDGPAPGSGCSAPTGCPISGHLMSPSIGDPTAPAYSSCSVNLMNSKVSTTSTCRTTLFCGDVNADRKSYGTCGDGSTSWISATDALIALKLSVGQANPVGYSHLGDVAAPFGELNATDANSLLYYSTCGSANVPAGYPPDCGN